MHLCSSKRNTLTGVKKEGPIAGKKMPRKSGAKGGDAKWHTQRLKQSRTSYSSLSFDENSLEKYRKPKIQGRPLG